MIDIIRINAKYKKALSRLTDKDKAYMLDGIFGFANDEIIEIKDSGAGDLLDLINGENELMCIKAVGKAKYEESKAIQPMVEPMVEPMVATKVKESKVKEDKIKESNIKQFKDFVEQNGNTNLTSILLKVLLELGYEPSKEETIESFREWFAGLGIPSDKCKKVIDNFYEYWIFEKKEGNIKKKKNWKLTFSNNPLLKDVTTS